MHLVCTLLIYTHLFLCILFSFFLALSAPPFPTQFSSPKSPLSGTSDQLFLVEKRQPARAGFWGRFWTGSPHRKKRKILFFWRAKKGEYIDHDASITASAMPCNVVNFGRPLMHHQNVSQKNAPSKRTYSFDLFSEVPCGTTPASSCCPHNPHQIWWRMRFEDLWKEVKRVRFDGAFFCDTFWWCIRGLPRTYLGQGVSTLSQYHGSGFWFRLGSCKSGLRANLSGTEGVNWGMGWVVVGTAVFGAPRFLAKTL